MHVLKFLKTFMKNDQWYSHISKNITPTQHGFMEGRTVSNFVTVTHFICETFDIGGQEAVLYNDFTKVLDWINHFVLLEKLVRLLRPLCLKLLQLYLNGKWQFVQWNGHASITYPQTSRISQGSITGLLLFIFPTNGVHSKLKVQFLFSVEQLSQY